MTENIRKFDLSCNLIVYLLKTKMNKEESFMTVTAAHHQMKNEVLCLF